MSMRVRIFRGTAGRQVKTEAARLKMTTAPASVVHDQELIVFSQSVAVFQDPLNALGA